MIVILVYGWDNVQNGRQELTESRDTVSVNS